MSASNHTEGIEARLKDCLKIHMVAPSTANEAWREDMLLGGKLTHGHSYEQIAEDLGVQAQTVRSWRNSERSVRDMTVSQVDLITDHVPPLHTIIYYMQKLIGQLEVDSHEQVLSDAVHLNRAMGEALEHCADDLGAGDDSPHAFDREELDARLNEVGRIVVNALILQGKLMKIRTQI